MSLANKSLNISENRVLEFDDYQDTVRDVADVLVVGSGPGGAVIAKELAELGHEVVLLEEGPPFKKDDFTPDAGKTMCRLFREAGMRAARGKAMFPTMQAIALGGGSVVNSAIAVRPPDWVFDKWSESSGLDLPMSELAEHFDRVEKFMGVISTEEDALGERNRLFKKGCDALGISSEPTPRNVQNCQGSGECFSGCRHGAKKSTDISYVPAAIKAGARVYTSVRAEEVILSNGRATGLNGHVVQPFTGKVSHRVSFDARKAVVLAAGCMATPQILMRSRGGTGPSGQVGQHLQFHPGGAFMGIWDHDVNPWEGATQGYHSLEYLKQGIKLEVLWAPASLLLTRFPGFGQAYKEQLARLRHMSPIDAIVAATRSMGSLRLRGKSWNPDLRYDLHPEDQKDMHRALILIAEIMWAAGAKSIVPGIHGLPPEITKDQMHLLKNLDFRIEQTTCSCNHAFGTTRMGANQKNSVVDSFGLCHHLENLYISDSGIIPMSPAVNPMLSIMALADRIAARIHHSI
jgi:choline dehydrogenase-like flavoprotein